MASLAKKYRISAKRKDEKEWTPWVSLNNQSEVGKHLKKIEELGYDARVECDGKIEVRDERK